VIRLAVRVGREHAEALLAELLVLVPGGLEERDLGEDAVEYVLYGAPGELPDIGSVRALAGHGLVDIRGEEVPDDWGERWKDFHQPILAGSGDRRVRVRPPWTPAEPGAIDVVIDPGQAFGTGSHATTRLVLELLCDLEPGGPLADWGCGSGLLAIAAAKLGWGPVTACDIEAESVAAAAENAQINGVADRVAVERTDLRSEGGPHAPTVLANLVRPLLLEVADALEQVPDRIVASGLERSEGDEVAAAFARHGLHEVRRAERGEWCAIVLERR
jgi:ribosomal protein L11 methyltransferase